MRSGLEGHGMGNLDDIRRNSPVVQFTVTRSARTDLAEGLQTAHSPPISVLRWDIRMMTDHSIEHRSLCSPPFGGRSGVYDHRFGGLLLGACGETRG